MDGWPRADGAKTHYWKGGKPRTGLIGDLYDFKKHDSRISVQAD